MLALTITLALALATGTAAASNGIQIEPLILHTATSPEVVFTEEGGSSLRCAVTLVASLHRSIAKVRDTLAGFVTEGRAERCRTNLGTGVIATILAERGEAAVNPPWHILYQSFAGTLPNITNVLGIILRASFLIGIRGPFGERLNECLYQGNIGIDARGAAANEIERIVVQETLNAANLFRIIEERGRVCARRGSLAATFTTTRRITLRLI